MIKVQEKHKNLLTYSYKLQGTVFSDMNISIGEGSNHEHQLQSRFIPEVVVATNIPAPKSVLRLYRKRWGIDCLFVCAKSEGFNLMFSGVTSFSDYYRIMRFSL